MTVDRLFPTGLPTLEWAEFEASGFDEPVSGLIHRAAAPAACGVPLGGVDTGCIDLETNGTLGFCTVFGNLMRRSINLPFLGLAVGDRTWTLTTVKLPGVDCARDIHYWGHYPVADLEYDLDGPVSAGLRAWSPFIPGDAAASNVPGAIFEVRLRNTSVARQKGTLAFSFSGSTSRETCVNAHFQQSLGIGPGLFRGAMVGGYHRGALPKPEAVVHRGVAPRWEGPPVVSPAPRAEYADSGVSPGQGYASYMLGVLGDDAVRLGGALDARGHDWARIATHLPEHDRFQPGLSIAVDFDLEPGQTRIVRFVLAWYAPRWWASGIPVQVGHEFTHMYAARFSHPVEVVDYLVDQHASLLARITAWQQVVYSERALPVWLRDSLVNILHLIAEDSVWAQAKAPIGDWCRPEDGLFGMNESPRVCPQMECTPCTYYGNLPIVYFFPELALSTLRAYKAYQFPDGAIPFIFGGLCGGSEGYEMTRPARAYQTTTNGPSYVGIVDRYWHCTGDDAFIHEFYPSVKRAVEFTMDLNRGPDGVISMPDRIVSENVTRETEWIETADWSGMAAHVGGIHLAMLRMAARMAKAVGDGDFAERCREWREQGSRSMEGKMWTGSYYLNSWDQVKGKRSDLVLSCQLDGDWMAVSHGLPPVFRPDRAQAALETVKRNSLPLARHGVVLFASPDGKPAPVDSIGYSSFGAFVSETLMVGMTYMYGGDRESGLDICYRLLHNVSCRQGLTWDMPCILRADTGTLFNGNDYYQALILWTVPAALEGKPVGALGWPGELVDRIVAAGGADAVASAGEGEGR